jgi:integration host factor subunit beta
LKGAFAPQALATPGKENRGMNKSQLSEALAKAENLTLKKTEKAVNALFENMADALANEERIEIRAFGIFKVKVNNGYKGRNPKTGDLIKVEGKKLPFFKVGKEMWERVDL